MTDKTLHVQWQPCLYLMSFLRQSTCLYLMSFLRQSTCWKQQFFHTTHNCFAAASDFSKDFFFVSVPCLDKVPEDNTIILNIPEFPSTQCRTSQGQSKSQKQAWSSELFHDRQTHSHSIYCTRKASSYVKKSKNQILYAVSSITVMQPYRDNTHITLHPEMSQTT